MLGGGGGGGGGGGCTGGGATNTLVVVELKVELTCCEEEVVELLSTELGVNLIGGREEAGGSAGNKMLPELLLIKIKKVTQQQTSNTINTSNSNNTFCRRSCFCSTTYYTPELRRLYNCIDLLQEL